MEKYFEKNALKEKSLDGLHDELFDDARIMSANIVVNIARGKLKEDFAAENEGRIASYLASSAFHMIATCEAILAKLPDGAVDEGLRRARRLVEREVGIEDLIKAAIGARLV